LFQAIVTAAQLVSVTMPLSAASPRINAGALLDFLRFVDCRYGVGMLSVGATTAAGFDALALHWDVLTAEAKAHG
jgi:hypothetical protein